MAKDKIVTLSSLSGLKAQCDTRYALKNHTHEFTQGTIGSDDDGYLTKLNDDGKMVPISLVNNLIDQMNLLIGRIKTLEEYAYWEDDEAPMATSMSISGPSEITTPGTYTYDVTVEPANAEVDLDITFTKKS